MGFAREEGSRAFNNSVRAFSIHACSIIRIVGSITLSMCGFWLLTIKKPRVYWKFLPLADLCTTTFRRYCYTQTLTPTVSRIKCDGENTSSDHQKLGGWCIENHSTCFLFITVLAPFTVFCHILNQNGAWSDLFRSAFTFLGSATLPHESASTLLSAPNLFFPSSSPNEWLHLQGHLHL